MMKSQPPLFQIKGEEFPDFLTRIDVTVVPTVDTAHYLI